jgi:hypothetical protein
MKELIFSKAEMEKLAVARNKSVTFDEDRPETAPERAVKIRRVNPPRGSPRYA